MEVILSSLNFVVHLDKHLTELAKVYGIWTYLILFLVIFCETGLVIMPFLPGDSLLFIMGALCANGELNIMLISIVLILAAIIGDTVNYQIGKLTGHKVSQMKNVPFLKREHLIKTQSFFEKHGGKTIIIARFIPIIRTFAPFVAGAGTMNYMKFICYNIVGAVLWVVIFITGGYFFGNIPMVEDNFFIVILGIIFISLIPGIIAVIHSKFEKLKNKGIEKNDN